MKKIQSWEELYKSNPFHHKWLATLKSLKRDIKSFEYYHNKLYKEIRNTLSHPKKYSDKKKQEMQSKGEKAKGDLDNIDLLRNNFLFDCYEKAWNTIV